MRGGGVLVSCLVLSLVLSCLVSKIGKNARNYTETGQKTVSGPSRGSLGRPLEKRGWASGERNDALKDLKMEATVLFRIVWMLLEVQEVVFMPIWATPTIKSLKNTSVV